MKYEIDRASSLSLQRQLYLALKEWFVADFTTEDLLPSEVAIAKKFGISQGTVRIALDNLVKEELIARVPGKGTFLNPDYKIKLKSYKVGVILSEVDFFSNTIWEYVSMHYLEVINGIVGSCLPYNISTEFISEDYFSRASDEIYDGYILWPYLQRAVEEMITKPYVRLQYQVDLADGFRLIAEDAAGKDHRKIGFIGFTTRERLRVVEEVLGPLPKDQIIECGGSADEAYRASIELFSLNPDMDCLICSTDIRAQGVLKYLKDSGRRIPGDVAVYGFDGTRNNRKITPALTTCRFDWKFPGSFAVKQIRTLLDGGAVQSFTPTKGCLIIQESTKH